MYCHVLQCIAKSRKSRKEFSRYRANAAVRASQSYKLYVITIRRKSFAETKLTSCQTVEIDFVVGCPQGRDGGSEEYGLIIRVCRYKEHAPRRL